MAVTADSVVIELLAKTDGYVANINGASNATTTALTKIEQSASRAEVQIVRSTGQMANAQRNLGRQISDIGTQLAGGQSPFLILAQQAPQVADALADTGGKAASVAAFFAGPWGAALLAAGSAVAVLAEKLLKTGEGLDDLVDKLRDNAAKAELTARAQEAFNRTLEGGAIASRELNEQLGKQIQTEQQAAAATLRSAEAQRQANIQTRQRIVSQIALTRALLEQDSARSRQGGERSELALGSRDRDQARLTKLKQDEAKATKAVADAQAAVVKASIPILDQRAAAAADKGAAATDRHAKALGRLRDAYIRAQAAAKNDTQREAAARTYREGRTRIDVGLANEQQAISDSKKKGPRGPSAAALAARAEAARVREVRNNEAYNNELEQINGQIIAAQRERAVSAAEVAEFERRAVESEYRKRKDAIAADLSAKKYTAAQAGTLDQANEQSRLLRLRNVAINEEVRTIQDMARRDLLTLNIQEEQLQADEQIAETRDERKKIELELISLKYQERRIQLDALRRAAKAAGDTGAVNDLTEQIEALPGLKRAEQKGVDQRSRGAYERYRRSTSDADSLADSIDAVKINTLEAITDELTQATTAALGLKGAFGQIVGELIRIGIQRKLIGPLADSLFGKADGSSAGGLGGFFKSVTSIFGRASGGYMAPNSLARVNEGRGAGVELLRMGSKGGTVIPLGQAAAQGGGGGTTVLQTIAVDARGAVMNDQFAQQILARANQGAQQVVNANNGALRKSLPIAQARLNQLGTTG